MANDSPLHGGKIVTDYLIVGAGITGLAFADEMVTRSTATLTIVDKGDVPGGHWNYAYPFVKLHQPSVAYGVESTEFAGGRIDADGPNAGFLSLASGPEIVAYCHAVMRNKLLPSGRVRYLPSTEYLADGTLRGVLSGKRTAVEVRRKLVDATRFTATIPLTHQRSFIVSDTVECIPPNFLPQVAGSFTRTITVLGAGKTGFDACIWLLDNGVEPDRIRWVIPRDQWYLNRKTVQLAPEMFEQTFGGFAASRTAIAEATDAADLARRQEQAGVWLRVSPDVHTPMYHAATCSEGEIAQVRRIKDIVRLGYVTAIGPTQMTLTRGAVASPPGTLYVDCTASALPMKLTVPIFQPGKIVIQMTRFPMIPFSAAQIAFVEARFPDDAVKNRIAVPVPLIRTVEDYIRVLPIDLANRTEVAKSPELREWARESRLDGYTKLVSQVAPSDTAKMRILQAVQQANAAAKANLPRLLQTLAPAPAPSARASL